MLKLQALYNDSFVDTCIRETLIATVAGINTVYVKQTLLRFQPTTTETMSHSKAP